MSLAFYIPAALALGLMIRYKRPWRETASVTAATMFLGMYCVVCLPGVLSGDGPYAPLINGLKEVSEVFSAEFISLGALDYAEALQETVSNYIAIIPDSLLSSMLLTAMIWGGASLLVVRAILKKKCDIRPMAFFREWQLSKSFVIGCLILFAGGLILSLMELPYAAAVYSCAEIIAVVPLAVQGVCTFDFLWYFRRKNVVGRVIAILLLVFLLPISPMLFGVLGLLEQFMKLRFRLKETARNSPPNT